MGDWLHGRKYVLALAVLAALTVTIVLVTRDTPFHPQSSYETVVSGTPDSHKFELAAGQRLGIRPILSHSKSERLLMAFTSIDENRGDSAKPGAVLQDCGRVGDCEVVWFRAPATGNYAVSIASASQSRLNVTVEYCVLDS